MFYVCNQWYDISWATQYVGYIQGDSLARGPELLSINIMLLR